MDLNIVKKETDDFSNIEMYIKTEPLNDESEFLTKASSIVKINSKDEIETKVNGSIVKTECVDIKNEVIYDPLDITNQVEDSENYLKSSKSKEIKAEEKIGNQLIVNKILHTNLNFSETSQNDQKFFLKKPKRKVCQECGKEFNQKSDLNKHLRVHSGEKPHSCFVCEKKFSRKSQLTRHFLIHTGLKPHQCDICKRAFRHKSAVDKHRLTHFDDRPFQCHQCDLKLRTQGDLNKHQRIHTGEKPYECDICKKAFVRQAHLDIHKRMHTGHKPYSCNLCHKTFKHSSGLKYHRLHGHKNEDNLSLTMTSTLTNNKVV